MANLMAEYNRGRRLLVTTSCRYFWVKIGVNAYYLVQEIGVVRPSISYDVKIRGIL